MRDGDEGVQITQYDDRAEQYDDRAVQYDDWLYIPWAVLQLAQAFGPEIAGRVRAERVPRHLWQHRGVLMGQQMDNTLQCLAVESWVRGIYTPEWG